MENLTMVEKAEHFALHITKMPATLAHAVEETATVSLELGKGVVIEVDFVHLLEYPSKVRVMYDRKILTFKREDLI